MPLEETDIANEDIVLAVKNKLGHGNFRILSQSLKTIEEKIGMLGDHAILNVCAMNNINNQETRFSFFVKLFPKQPTVAAFAQGAGAFQKEEFAYELFGQYKKCGINPISHCTANCYVAAPNKYLILDNLSELDYVMPDKMEYFDFNVILAVLQSLAQLHASSIIYEEKMSKELNKPFTIFEGNEETFRDTLYCDSEDFINRDAVDCTLKCVLTEIKVFEFPELLSSGRSFVEVTKEVFPKLYDLVKPSKTYRNVLCHGDLWTSNLMLNNKSDITSCKFVDFQNSRYVPPSHDVLSVIFLTTSREFRKNHLYELLGIYYNYLEKVLKISGHNLTEIIPFSDFLDSCEEQKLFAILSAVAIIPLILSRRDSIEMYYSDKELYQKVFREDRSVLITDNQDNEDFMVRAKESVEDLLEECEKFANTL